MSETNYVENDARLMIHRCTYGISELPDVIFVADQYIQDYDIIETVKYNDIFEIHDLYQDTWNHSCI